MAQFGGMEFQVDDMQWNDLGLVRRLTGEASVRDAAETGQRLVSLWPLTTSLHMDNDVKYAEELQVRLTLQFAKLLVGDPDVAGTMTLADADFVYEGADAIPGRPQSVVDALVKANAAYDDAAGYSDDGDVNVILQAANRLGARGKDAKEFGRAMVDGDAFVAKAVHEAASLDEQAERLGATFVAVGLASFAAMVGARADAEAIDGNLEAGSVAAMLYCNELAERYGVPRLFVTDENLVALNKPMPPADFVRALAPLASAEWSKHRADILWDPDKAKADAEEVDKKRNREELAKKFR